MNAIYPKASLQCASYYAVIANALDDEIKLHDFYFTGCDYVLNQEIH